MGRKSYFTLGAEAERENEGSDGAERRFSPIRNDSGTGRLRVGRPGGLALKSQVRPLCGNVNRRRVLVSVSASWLDTVALLTVRVLFPCARYRPVVRRIMYVFMCV